MAEPSWTWDLIKFIYLGVNGLLTQNPPGTGFFTANGVADQSHFDDGGYQTGRFFWHSPYSTLRAKGGNHGSEILKTSFRRNQRTRKPLVTSAGAGDAGRSRRSMSPEIRQLLYGPWESGRIPRSFPLPRNLAAGDLVNVWNDSGTAKARKADATTAGERGERLRPLRRDPGNNATVYFDGNGHPAFQPDPGSGLLSRDHRRGGNGHPAFGSGNVLQRVGRALSATELTFEPGEPITWRKKIHRRDRGERRDS